MFSALSIWVKLLLLYFHSYQGLFAEISPPFVALLLSVSKLQPSKYIPVVFIIILAFMPGSKRRDFFY